MKSIVTIRQEKGAVAPLVAIMLILIIVCVALVVDLGHVHNVKIQLQRAVDAAALAAAQQLPDGDPVGVAVAVGTANTADQGGVTILPADVVVGTWDKDALGSSAATRFTALSALPTGTDATAVRVTATRDVGHYFFTLFGNNSTPVTADAIAVNIYEEQTVPLALVSCIPSGGKASVASPGLSICDIATYSFHGDTEDTAAWTSLTFNPASQDNIIKFLDEDGIKTFNQVVYGTGLGHDGIEFTDVADETLSNRSIPVPDFSAYSDITRGCIGNNGLSIACGLGPDPSVDPDDIDLIRRLAPSKVTSNPASDPLDYTPLPRWYHFDDDDSTYDIYNDAFTRLLTQDGVLDQDSTTLGNLYNGTTPSPFGADDYRFKASGSNEKFIKYDNSKKIYKPNYNEVLRYAGYPPVWVSNGTIPPALVKFVDDLINPSTNKFKSAVSGEFDPFKVGNETNSGGSGETVRLTVPVIFAGNCDEWKALSVGPPKSDIKLYYVGTANFLVTRAWKNPDCYDHGDRAIQITVSTPSDGSCTVTAANDYDPALTSDLKFQCTSGKAPNIALEGMIRPPTRGEKSDAGIRKIYLVE